MRCISIMAWLTASVALAQDAQPWSNDLQATRESAEKAGKPSVLILNAEKPGL